jgi:hypothetical protein
MSEWKTIDSAPKDGTYILLVDQGNYLLARWRRNAWWSQLTNSGRAIVWHEATHWMPLPPPPSTT